MAKNNIDFQNVVIKSFLEGNFCKETEKSF